MRAVVVREWMEPSELRVETADDPPLRSDGVLVDVRAAGCNFFDTLIVRGKYQSRPDFPFIPGGEIAGVVRAVGEQVEGFAPGDRVLANVGLGGFAERICVEARRLHAIPDSMSFEAAAAFPIVYGTAWVSVVQRGRLAAGESLLVTSAAGGVGLACIQIGKAMGAQVIALAGGSDKLAITQEAGADVNLDYADPKWSDAVIDATGGRGADVIVENVGGEIFDACTRCIAWDGRLVVVGFSSREIPSIRLNRVLLKHISLVGVHFPPMLDHQPELLASAYRELFALHTRGKLEPIVWKTYSLEELPEALADLESRKTWGKLVVTL